MPQPPGVPPSGTSTVTVTSTATETFTTTVLSTTTITTGGPIVIEDLSEAAWYKLYQIMAVSKYVTDRGKSIEENYPL